MKHLPAAAVIVALGAVFTSASAEVRPVVKAPQKTMGDEGKLPATATVGGGVPEMGAIPADSNARSGSTSPKGPAKRMGDAGKLPATATMGGAVPEMSAPDPSKK